MQKILAGKNHKSSRSHICGRSSLAKRHCDTSPQLILCFRKVKLYVDCGDQVSYLGTQFSTSGQSEAHILLAGVVRFTRVNYSKNIAKDRWALIVR